MEKNSNNIFGEKIIRELDHCEGNVSTLIKKIYIYRNEVKALKNKIESLENENIDLKEKKELTVVKMKDLLQKFQEAGM